MREVSKLDQAREVFLDGMHKDQTRQMVIDRLMTEVELTEFGAQTYFQNLKRQITTRKAA